MDDFRELLVEQIPSLRRYARSLTGDKVSADDLVQDCMNRAWSRKGQWRPDSDLRAWLFTIMHSLYVNQLRRGRFQEGWEDLDIREHRNPSLEGQERAMVLRDLESGLNRLPPDQRELLMLVAIEEMSYQQVAGILDLPIGTVMSRLHRARESLRRWMGRERSLVLRRVK
jgi:RNA polymerase sigma-70 factor (ECF subfamily)